MKRKMVKRTALAKRSNNRVKKRQTPRRNSKKKNRKSFGSASKSLMTPPMASCPSTSGSTPSTPKATLSTTSENKSAPSSAKALSPTVSDNVSSPLPSNLTATDPTVIETEKNTCNKVVEKPDTILVPMDVCNDSSSKSIISISDSSSDESNPQAKVTTRSKRKNDSCFIIDVEPTDLKEKSSFYEYVDNDEESENRKGRSFRELLKPPRTRNRLIEKIYPSLNDETLPSSTSSENPVETYVINESSDDDNARSFNHSLDVNASHGAGNDSNKSDTYKHYNGLQQLTTFITDKSRKKNKKNSLKRKRRQIPAMANTDDELGPDDEFGPADRDPNDEFSADDEFGPDDQFGPGDKCSNSNNNPKRLATDVDAFQNRYKNRINESDNSPLSLVSNWINKINQDTPYEDLVKQTSFQPVTPQVNKDKHTQNNAHATASNKFVNLVTPERNVANGVLNNLNSNNQQTDVPRRSLGINTDQLINCIETITNINTDQNPHSHQKPNHSNTDDPKPVIQNEELFSSLDDSPINIPYIINDTSDKPSTEQPSTSRSSERRKYDLPQPFILLKESSDSDVEFVDEYNPHDHLIELSDEDSPVDHQVKKRRKPAKRKPIRKINPKRRKMPLTKKRDGNTEKKDENADKKDDNKETDNEVKNELDERLRPIVIDGCNVGMGHSRSKQLSVAGIKICYDYFINKGHEVKIFLPQNKKYHPLTTDTRQLEKWEREGVLVFTPGRKVDGLCIYSYDDRFILEYAALKGAIVITRDNYRDLYAERADFRDTILNRLLQYTFVDDLIMFPSDPLGRKGPHLDKFLKFSSTPGELTALINKGDKLTK